MPNIPFTFDYTTERDGANAGLAIGITQQVTAAREKAARGDASVGIVGIGSAGAPSQNPMAIGVTASGNYQQPNSGNPKANPAGTVSKSNPMGL